MVTDSISMWGAEDLYAMESRAGLVYLEDEGQDSAG